MKLISRGLMVLASFLLVACSSMPSPFFGVNKSKVEGLSIAETIKTKEIYGTWGISNDDPIDFLYLVVFKPNHSGVSYLTMDEKDGKPESKYSEYYTWEFNEKEKLFTMKVFKRNSIENGKPEEVETLKEVRRYETTMYKEGNNPLAIRFNAKGEEYIFLKMDEASHQRIQKGIPEMAAGK
jgi:hypothetical protein